MPFERISDQNSDYLANRKYVGIFVSGDSASHAGLVYGWQVVIGKKADGTPATNEGTNEFHFVPHEIKGGPLKSSKKYLIASFDFDDRTAKGFAAMLKAVDDNKPQIRYGLDWENALGSFNSKGDYIDPERRLGLTCSTFVSELIAGHGFPAVDYETWPHNDPKDLDWRTEQERLYNLRLTEGRTRMTNDDIHAMMDVDPLVRLKPSQIAGAASSDFNQWPFAHATADAIAKKVIATFEAEFPPPPKQRDA